MLTLYQIIVLVICGGFQKKTESENCHEKTSKANITSLWH